ncbi:MAG: polyprenyl synthetase family protein [Deltaproteobacteria bacterium]|nr:polyprenyl synthetase family protein [Deltaproteobacteria bacterium]
MRHLCEQRADRLEAELKKQGRAPCLELPYLLSLGFSGDISKARKAAALSGFIYLGCDILDDLHDNELPEDQKNLSPALISLAGSLLLTSLPTMAIARFFDDEKSRFAACQAVSEALMVMAQGQSKDILSRFDGNLSVEDMEASVAAKSGEEMALFCRFAALMAGQDEKTVRDCMQLGRDLSVALQIISDLTDIYENSISTDLGQGTLTIPLALHLLRLAPKEKDSFIGLWKESGKNPAARFSLQQMLKNSGGVAHASMMIESYSEKALLTLNSLPLGQVARNGLEELIETISRYAIGHLHDYFEKTGDAPMSARLMGM